MLHRLKKLFPSLVTEKDSEPEHPACYEWYMTAENGMIGIAKNDMSQNDINLLSAFLTPCDRIFPRPSSQEKAWKDLIKADTMREMQQANTAFRFVYFSIQKHHLDPASFKEAIEDIFQQQVPILWENENQGVIIEEMLEARKDETLSYEQIIDTLMSDLYVKISFFVGAVLTDYKDVSDQYDTVLNGARIAFAYSGKPVLTYIDVIPYLFIEEMEPDKRKHISRSVLKETIHESDMLETMETFMRSNLNISETAKALYMHRNTLQYRLDKFYEKTGIDVRRFHQAMSLYLIIKAIK